MNYTKWIVSGIVGGILNFIMGYVFFGLLANSSYPENAGLDLPSVILGSLTLGLMLSYIFIKWGHISTLNTGFKAGITLGIFLGLLRILFQQSDLFSAELAMMGWEFIISILIISVTGAGIGFTLHKMNSGGNSAG